MESYDWLDEKAMMGSWGNIKVKLKPGLGGAKTKTGKFGNWCFTTSLYQRH